MEQGNPKGGTAHIIHDTGGNKAAEDVKDSLSEQRKISNGDAGSHGAKSRQESDGENKEEMVELTWVHKRPPDDHQRPISDWLARFYARFFWLIAIISGSIGGVCIIISFVCIPLPNFDDPTKGFDARNTYISARSRTFLGIFKNHDHHLSPNQSLIHPRSRRDVPNVSYPKVWQGTCPKNEDQHGGSFNVAACKNQFIDPSNVKLVFESTDQNKDLFNLRSFQSICDIETTIVCPSQNMPCHHMISLPMYTAVHSKKPCGDLTEEDVTSMKNLLIHCYPYFKGKEMDKNAPAECTDDNIVHNILYYLTDANFVPSHNASSMLTYTTMVYNINPPNLKTYFQNTFEGRDVSHGSVKLVSFYGTINDKFSLFSEYLETDLLYYIAILACVLILLIMCVYLFSAVLGIATFINVGFSFTTAYVIYYYILGIKFFPFINLLAALILIAVGADDVFIFYDAWKQAKKDDDHIPLENRVGRAFSHAAASIAVTSLTTSASFFANYVTNIISIKCFALFAGLAVLSNFLYMLTWTPSIIIGIHVVQKHFMKLMRTVTNGRIGTTTKCCRYFRHLRTRFSQAIFSRCLPWLIEKAWFVWLPLLLLLGVGGLVTVFYYPKLQLPKSKEFQLFPTSQYMEYWDQKTKMEFRYEQDSEDKYQIPIYFVWGYLPEDNGKWYDQDDLGELMVDEEFDLYSKESQTYLKKFAEDLLNSDVVDVDKESKDKKHFSFFEAAADVLKRCKIKGGTDAYFHKAFKQCCNETAMPFSREYLTQCLPQLSLGVNAYVSRSSVIGRPLFDNANKLTGFLVEISSNRYFTTSYQEMDEYYYKLDKFVRAQNEEAPVGLRRGFVSGKYEFQFYALQKAIASGTYYSILLSLCAAATLMFLTTLNVLLTVYAMLTITLAISVTIGCFVLLGWHLNIVESITISLAVGLSIDFTIHYGVSYRLSKENHRLERMRESFSRVGSSIVMAALTTFMAGAAMMPTKIMPYLQLGIFLMVVMTFSWVYSTFFFMSLCRIIGPNGNFCQIPILCCKKTNNEEEEEEEGGTYRPTEMSDPTLALDPLGNNIQPFDDFMIVP